MFVIASTVRFHDINLSQIYHVYTIDAMFMLGQYVFFSVVDEHSH